MNQMPYAEVRKRLGLLPDPAYDNPPTIETVRPTEEYRLFRRWQPDTLDYAPPVLQRAFLIERDVAGLGYLCFKDVPTVFESVPAPEPDAVVEAR